MKVNLGENSEDNMYLGIDLGTSSIKLAVIDESGSFVEEMQESLTIHAPHPLWSEQNPKDWIKGFAKALKKLQTNLTSIKAIGLSGQMHGACLLDKNDQVLRPAILWNDGRSFKECSELETLVPNYAEICANKIMPGFTAPKLVWVKKHEKQIFEKVAKVLLPKDYLRLHLTGEYATDMSDASGTMWLNVEKRKWSEEMLHACSLTKEHMPKAFEGTQITGKVRSDIAKLYGLNDNCIVIAGGGDNAASAISMNVIHPGKAFLSIGTSGVLFVSSKQFSYNIEGNIHSMCHCLPNLWHQMSVHLSSASCLDWYSEISKMSINEMIEIAQSSPITTHSPMFLPYLNGERTPYNDANATGVFFALVRNTTNKEMINAILEGVAFAFLDGFAGLKQAGTQIDCIDVVGGGANSLYWGKIIASALNQTLTYRKNRSVGAALGAARLAFLGATNKDPFSTFTDGSIEHSIDPESNLKSIFDKKHPLYQKLYNQLKQLYQIRGSL